MGERLQWQCQMVLGTSPGKIDLCIVFHRRAVNLLRPHGCYGMLATSNIAEGSAIEVGLGVIVQSGSIHFARKGMPWPGSAAAMPMGNVARASGRDWSPKRRTSGCRRY